LIISCDLYHKIFNEKEAFAYLMNKKVKSTKRRSKKKVEKGKNRKKQKEEDDDLRMT